MPEVIITGEVSVELCESRVKRPCWNILLMGPTGAGKSSFIEALAGEGQSLGISNDQMAAFTQEVTAYEVKNMAVNIPPRNIPIYLIDTPGFSDARTSELEIMTKVEQWMLGQGLLGIQGTLLYLSPITVTRLPGSRRQMIRLIQSLANQPMYTYLGIVTTMWDGLSRPRDEKRAETNFAELQDDIWQRPISKGATISRFHNDYDSALQIIRHSISAQVNQHSPVLLGRIHPEDSSAPLLYQELLDRISNAQQAKQFLQMDKIQLITSPDPQMESVVLARLPEVRHDLAKFLRQLIAFGSPPPGFEGGIPERRIYQNLLDDVNGAREEQTALQEALAHLHTEPDPEREAALTDQLNLIERDLEQHVMRLVERGVPPEGFENALKQALQLPVPNVSSLTEDSDSDHESPTTTPPDLDATSSIDPRLSSTVHSEDSTAATPGGDTSATHLASAEHPQRSVTASQASSKDRKLKKGFHSVIDKLPFRSKRER